MLQYLSTEVQASEVDDGECFFFDFGVEEVHLIDGFIDDLFHQGEERGGVQEGRECVSLEYVEDDHGLDVDEVDEIEKGVAERVIGRVGL